MSTHSNSIFFVSLQQQQKVCAENVFFHLVPSSAMYVRARVHIRIICLFSHQLIYEQNMWPEHTFFKHSMCAVLCSVCAVVFPFLFSLIQLAFHIFSGCSNKFGIFFFDHFDQLSNRKTFVNDKNVVNAKIVFFLFTWYSHQ